jgi:hypothetical protein
MNVISLCKREVVGIAGGGRPVYPAFGSVAVQ